MSTKSLDIIAIEQGEIPMEKIPVSILLWSKYNHYVIDIQLRLEKEYGLIDAEHDIIGCAEIRGKLFESDIEEIEDKYIEIVGVFKDSDFPKRPFQKEEEADLPMLPGEVGT